MKKIFMVLCCFVLVFGLWNCAGSPTPKEPDKVLVITGITGISSANMRVELTPDVDNDSRRPANAVDVNVSGSVTVPLKWNGSGEYFVVIWAPVQGGPPTYTTSEKVRFTSETTTINWSQFITYDEWRSTQR